MTQKLLAMAKKFPVIAIVGPRQSGKTTLSKAVFPNHKYLSMEDIRNKEFAIKDPHDFFEAHKNEHGIILDEVQTVPELFSYIQVYADEHDIPGYIVIIGSQNFLMNEAITQSLAGRVAIHTLLPFSISELKQADFLPARANEIIYTGFYPKIYDKNLDPADWYSNYLHTYVERDVRQIINVNNLRQFQYFLRLCAGRIGQILKMSSIANDCGISVSTVKSWLSLLEASYIIFLLQPYNENFNKRLIKKPKIYFYDSGLACYLLEIESVEQLSTHYLRGGLFESCMISELLKQRYNVGRRPNVYFWRNTSGEEIDCVFRRGAELYGIEIKAGQTVKSDAFSGLTYWSKISKGNPANNFLIYSGSENYKRNGMNVVSWKDIDSIV